jgi:hypothetical protein
VLGFSIIYNQLVETFDNNAIQYSLRLVSMICIVVIADVIGFTTSEQRTTVPLKPMLTESIDKVETRGEAP